MSVLKSNLILVLSFFLLTAQGQSDKSALEKKRARLIEDIELTSQLVDQAKKKSQATLSDVQVMETQLKQRKELVQVLDSELSTLMKQSKSLQDSIEQIKQIIDSDKKEYGIVLNKAHIKSRLDHPFQYLVDGASIFEGFQKWIYLNQFKRYIVTKLDALTLQTQLLMDKSAELNKVVARQTENLNEAQENKKKVEEDTKARQQVLNALKKDVASLEKKLKSQKAERKRLNDAIEKLILAELEKNRKKREANTLPVAELAELSAEFQNNKGRLPWPVTKGVITTHFGRQSHPDIKGVFVDNTGIDLVTDENQQVKTVFEGTVVGTTVIAGHQNMIIISHGDFYTVYSKLKTVSVSQGQSVSTGTTIGTTGKALDGLGNLHFEIWKGKSKVNPEHWIKR